MERQNRVWSPTNTTSIEHPMFSVDLNKIEQCKRNHSLCMHAWGKSLSIYAVNSAMQQARFITFKSVLHLLFWFFFSKLCYCCCWIRTACIHLFWFDYCLCARVCWFIQFYYAITNRIRGDSMSKGSTHQHVVIQLLFFPIRLVASMLHIKMINIVLLELTYISFYGWENVIARSTTRCLCVCPFFAWICYQRFRFFSLHSTKFAWNRCWVSWSETSLVVLFVFIYFFRASIGNLYLPFSLSLSIFRCSELSF